MQHADDVFGIVAIERHTRVAETQGGLDNIRGRQVGVDQIDLLAVDHDLADVELLQVEDAAEHVAVVAAHSAFVVVVFDGAADFFMRRQDVDFHRQADAEQAQDAAHEPLHGVDDGPEGDDDPHHGTRHEACCVVRTHDSQGFRQDFGEYQNQHRHDAG